jgi:hypothetical protein
MKTLDLNYKMILLLTTLLALSAMIVSGLVSADGPANADGAYSNDLTQDLLSPPAPSTPEKKSVPVTPKQEEKPAATSSLSVVTLETASSKVTSFVPEFDEEWCKARYPEYIGKKINLGAEDLVIVDKSGSRITDYNELSLKLSPGLEASKAGIVEKDYKFNDNAYVAVKGVGPMKLRAIRFSYETGGGK